VKVVPAEVLEHLEMDRRWESHTVVGDVVEIKDAADSYPFPKPKTGKDLAQRNRLRRLTLSLANPLFFSR
jgi:hypothetical protein